jgi:transcriptional regulator with XRE-family HTH domain
MMMRTDWRKLRRERGITLKAVKVATRIDIGYLSRVERGVQSAPAHIFARLARFYGIDWTPEEEAHDVAVTDGAGDHPDRRGRHGTVSDGGVE